MRLLAHLHLGAPLSAVHQRTWEKFFEDNLLFGVEIPGLVRNHQGFSRIEDTPNGITFVQHCQAWQNHNKNSL